MPAQPTSIKLDPEMKDRVQALATSRDALRIG
jgi:predicted transcriptional regulator